MTNGCFLGALRTQLPDLSLPLMGIGNQCLRDYLVGYHRLSLPLMGIGNQLGACASRREPTTHYPSWGSGTVRLPGHCIRLHLLITPHGDRELDFRVQLTAPPRTPHYPSWGSGTRHAVGVEQRAVPLITPHGDREPGACGWRRPASTPLITPHGDRELGSPFHVFVDFGLFSLPLMGIGNFTMSQPMPCPTSTHYTSWGSGTPSGCRDESSTRTAHYPSWGSGTLVLQSRTRADSPRKVSIY